MAHLTGTLHIQRAQVGDTFTKDGLDYKAVPMIGSFKNKIIDVCEGCAFCYDNNPHCDDYETPDCVSYDVIFIRAQQN